MHHRVIKQQKLLFNSEFSQRIKPVYVKCRHICTCAYTALMHYTLSAFAHTHLQYETRRSSRLPLRRVRAFIAITYTAHRALHFSWECLFYVAVFAEVAMCFCCYLCGEEFFKYTLHVFTRF